MLPVLTVNELLFYTFLPIPTSLSCRPFRNGSANIRLLINLTKLVSIFFEILFCPGQGDYNEPALSAVPLIPIFLKFLFKNSHVPQRPAPPDPGSLMLPPFGAGMV